MGSEMCIRDRDEDEIFARLERNAAAAVRLAKPTDPYLLEERRWLKSCKQFAPDTSSNRTARLQVRAGG